MTTATERLDASIRNVRQRAGIEQHTGLLGDDATGLLKDPNRPGYYYVRRFEQEGFLNTESIRLATILNPQYDLPVWLGYDANDELVITGVNTEIQVARGGNPALNNPGDQELYQWVTVRRVQTFRSHVAGTPETPTTTLSIREWVYLHEGELFVVPSLYFDIVDEIPGADEKAVIAIGASPSGEFVYGLSSILPLGEETESFSVETYQQAIDACPAGSRLSGFWELKNGVTELTEDNRLDVDPRCLLGTEDIGGLRGVPTVIRRPTHLRQERQVIYSGRLVVLNQFVTQGEMISI